MVRMLDNDNTECARTSKWLAGISAYISAALRARLARKRLRMARTKSMDDEESFEIEVLRNINQLHASSTLLGANNTASSTHDLSLTCRDSYRKAANLNPGRGRGSGELRNGCCHSTPVQRSASNNIPLKEYFSKLSLPVVSTIETTFT